MKIRKIKEKEQKGTDEAHITLSLSLCRQPKGCPHNRMTKMAYFVPTTEKTLVEEVARLFWDNVWKLHGLPESIITDRGAQFAARMMKELN